MKRFVRLLPAPILLGLLSAPLYASPMGVLTWDECVAKAGAANPKLLSSGYRYETSLAQIEQNRGALFPQLNLNGTAGRGSNGRGVGSFGVNDNTTASTRAESPQDFDKFDSGSVSNSYNVSLALRQEIFSGFRTQSLIEQAKKNAESSKFSLQSIKADVSYELKNNFSSLRYAQELRALTEQIAARRDNNQRLVQLRYEGGRENKGSYLFARANYVQARFEHLQARNAVAVAQEALARTLGMDASAPVEIQGGVPLDPPPPSADLQALSGDTPDVLIARAQREIAETNVSIARSNFYPDVSGLASTGRLGSDWMDTSADDLQWYFGIEVDYPLFTGGSNTEALRAAESDVRASRQDERVTRDEVVVTLRQTLRDYQEAVENVEVDKTYVEAASVRAEIGRNKYDNGLLSFEDWDDIENDLINRQKNLLQSTHNRVLAQAAWQQALGESVFP